MKLRASHRAPQKVLEMIVGFIERVDRPVYLGHVSLEVGWSLERTQEMMDLLEEKGVVRKLTLEEKSAQHYPSVAHLYVLIKRACDDVDV